jgi:hypothetical protein
MRIAVLLSPFKNAQVNGGRAKGGKTFHSSLNLLIFLCSQLQFSHSGEACPGLEPGAGIQFLFGGLGLLDAGSSPA